MAGYVEPIAFQEVLPNEPGEWTVRGTVVALRDAAPQMASGTSTYIMPTAELNFGILERLAGEVELPFVMRANADGRDAGLGNVGVALTYLVCAQHGAWPHVTAMLEVHAPTASEPAMDRQTEIEAAWGLAMVRPGFVVQATVGASTTIGDRTEYALVDHLSIAVALPARMHVFGELIAETTLPAFEVQLLAGPGLKVRVTRTLFVAASALFGVRDAAARATAQVQYDF